MLAVSEKGNVALCLPSFELVMDFYFYYNIKYGLM